MPATYDKMGISFQYPENWTLDEEDARAGLRAVTVLSPGGAFWSVAVHPGSADPEKMAKAAVDAMRQEYEGVEAEVTCEQVAGCEMVGFDLDFFYLDLVNMAKIRCFRVGGGTYTIFCQAEDREFAEVGGVFEAMTASLIQGLVGEGESGD